MLQNLSVTVYNSEALAYFEEKDGGVVSVITDKKTLKTDLVILGMGTAPNTFFEQKSKIKLSQKEI